MSELIATIVGSIMPAIIEFVITKVGADKIWLKYFIALGSCVVVGATTTTLVDGVELFNAENILGDIGLAFIASQTVYNTYWKNSGLQKKLIEKLNKPQK